MNAFFFAVELSDAAREQAAQRIELLRAQFHNLRVGWEKSQNLHLTLKFLGKVEVSKLPEVIRRTEQIARQISPFELKIAGSNVFPPRGLARILWLDVADGRGALQQLNQKLEEQLFAVGFERENRLFTPHLTIARLREPHRSQELANFHVAAQFSEVSCPVGEIVLLQSLQTARGIIYHPFSRIAFNQ